MGEIVEMEESRQQGYFGKRQVVMIVSILVPLITLVVKVVLGGTLQAFDADSNRSAFDTGSNRPLVHYTPEHGWMNDPNGLFYDKHDKLWHLYFQYNPNATVWDLPLYWGHATSPDLTRWEDHGAVIAPDNDDEGIYSGSIVIDHDNTSGFFNESVHPDQRVVAIYTNNIPDLETQDLAYSVDGGFSFIKYSQNPVLDVDSAQFRDPKVFWHKPTSQWIMVVAKSQEYKVQIFGSADLKNWHFHSNFTGGYPGFQYECPGLIEVPVINTTETKWVMFVAINPGSPMGGSSNEYFVGEFDGVEFRADDSYTRFVDYGKDYYALQTFSEVDHGAIGVAWASNWQYANKVPTKGWRSSMSLARNFSLDYVQVNPATKMLSLVQTPIMVSNHTCQEMSEEKYAINRDNSMAIQAQCSGLFEFDIRLKVIDDGISHLNDTFFDVVVSSGNGSQVPESIRIGFDPVGDAFYLDRGIATNKFSQHPLFTDKVSVYAEPMASDADGYKVYNMYGIIDRNIVELYLNEGRTTMTNTFFMSEGNTPRQMEVRSSIDNVFVMERVRLRELQV